MLASALALYLHACAPNVAPSTMRAIIRTETNGKPYTIALNHGYKLIYQPHNYTQAQAWVIYLEKHHYNFDEGIAQVNINNVHKYGYTATEALDPCTNLQISSHILQKDYIIALHSSKTSHQALLKAISLYNTGNSISGFYNGYVDKVVYNAVGYRPY